jgi:type IV pilus assembly protein PilM
MAGSQTAWGLDVGVTSLKAIKLRRDGELVSVEAYDVVEHDKFLSDPDVDRDAMIQQTLQKFLLRNPIKRERVYIGVPGSATFARFVKLPPVEPRKVPEIVKFEAIQQIPFPLDQVNWDYHTFQSPESPDVEVGIFAMKKELVAQVLSNFRAAGLTIAGVQMSPLAVYNAAAYDGLTDDKGTVLIDMGAEHTDLVIMDQGRLWLRTINIGGNHFTDALAKSFKQSFSKAEALKKGAATSKYQKQIFQAMRPIFADLVADIQRSIGHYNSSHRDSRLERIVGMGNPFKLPNLQKYLQQELKMEVIRLDNFRKMKTDPKLGAGLNDAILSMTTAYGLASQGLGLAPIDTNLLPIELARQMMWQNKQPWFIGAAAILLLAVGGTFVQYFAAKSTFAATQGDDRTKNDNAMGDALRAKSAWPNVAQFDTDKAQIDQILGLAQARTVWPQLTLDILDALPQAKNPDAVKTPGSRIVVITNITSQYYGALSSVSTLGSVLINTPNAPTPDQAPGGNPDDPNQGMGMPPPQPTAAVNPNQVGPSDHGFLITINGYSPPVPGTKTFEVPREFLTVLMQRYGFDKDHPANPVNKPYYFSDPGFGGQVIPEPVPGATTTSNGFWGAAQGPYAAIFGPGIASIQPATQPAMIGGVPENIPQATPGNYGGPVDPFFRDPQHGPHYMYGYFQFSIQMKVHIR